MTLRAVLAIGWQCCITLWFLSTEAGVTVSVVVDDTAAGHLASGFIPEDRVGRDGQRHPEPTGMKPMAK